MVERLVDEGLRNATGEVNDARAVGCLDSSLAQHRMQIDEAVVALMDHDSLEIDSLEMEGQCWEPDVLVQPEELCWEVDTLVKPLKRCREVDVLVKPEEPCWEVGNLVKAAACLVVGPTHRQEGDPHSGMMLSLCWVGVGV